MSGPSLIAAAALIIVVPTVMYVALLWLADPYEREPLSDMGLMLLIGAVVAPLITAAVESALGIPISVSPALFQLIPVVPPNVWSGAIEEAAKGLVVLGAFMFLRREFDDTLDGVVYGAVVGAGFALAEAVVYLRDLLPLAGAASLGAQFFFGLFIAGLSQCVFTSFFGASLGYMREEAPGRWGIPLLGFLVAALYHMGYIGLGYLATAPTSSGMEAFWAGLGRRLADWGGLLLVIVMLRWAWVREQYIFGVTLPDEVASGAVTKDELAYLTTGHRVGRQVAAWRHAGWRRYLELRRLHQAQAELAFAKWRISRGLGDADEAQRQREEIRHLRERSVRRRGWASCRLNRLQGACGPGRCCLAWAPAAAASP